MTERSIEDRCFPQRQTTSKSILPANNVTSSIISPAIRTKEAVQAAASSTPQASSPSPPPELSLGLERTAHGCEAACVHSHQSEPSNSQFGREVNQGDENYFSLDEDDQIFLPSAPESNYEAQGDDERHSEDGEIQQEAETLDNNLPQIETQGTEILDAAEDSLTKDRGNDGDRSGEEENSEEDSDLELLPEEAIEMEESDSDSDPDIVEDVNSGDTLQDTAAVSTFSAKEFLEHTWSHLCDCEEEEALRTWMLGFNEMAEYWRDFKMPDAIGNVVTSSQIEQEGSVD